ncbi:sensor histidine kinase [Propionimicrobium sp. PCR01-08-3]|uniref:sensor histidine kinase n=1 Tax=Propionimicrobium sp. PCR01-08-3 TaxID=3052086 RepID=UPI00255CA07C|nr:sensor histidine kinase [Propionimicrobium sp. PCR01-08-3]WIY83567.1 sensor histidine kinase [Propionimicrobium sp. PCR01-08-3]
MTRTKRTKKPRRAKPARHPRHLRRPKHPRRPLNRRRLLLGTLAFVCVVLYSILAPIHVVLYGSTVAVALIFGGALCGAPLLALFWPRIAIVAFCSAAFVLPLTVSAARDDYWPWPWSVPAMMAFMCLILVITIRHGWLYGLVPLAVSIMGSLAAPLMFPEAASLEAAGADLIVTASLSGVTFLVGVLIAARMRVGQELDKEREVSATEQSRRMLVEERNRIARELHDVVAHSMSVIQVQASTARYRIADVPDDAAAEFDEIAALARKSLTEMRRLLGVLRTEDESPQLTPQQGMADIPALVENTRHTGARVELTFEPGSQELAASVQIAAYRIVQESLSNALRHAPGAPIEVELGVRDQAVRIRVHNEPAAGTTITVPAAGAGHGLRGMRERVALVDGSLAAGPDPAGGWTVTAVLPYNDTSEERP